MKQLFYIAAIIILMVMVHKIMAKIKDVPEEPLTHSFEEEEEVENESAEEK